uniref:RING-type E3 ubiquitin transferase n=1 Tax=Parascaris univalens TaxID=6257 RepID=A0A915C097_PARUN
MASGIQSQEKRASEQNAVGQDSRYECNICYFEAKEPVVLICGHFFCWQCIDTWLERKSTCPVCNGDIDRNKDVITIYGKGLSQSDMVKPRPQAPTQTRTEREREMASLSQQSSSEDTLWKIGLGVMGGAVAGALLHSLFGGSSSSRERRGGGGSGL